MTKKQPFLTFFIFRKNCPYDSNEFFYSHSTQFYGTICAKLQKYQDLFFLCFVFNSLCFPSTLESFHEGPMKLLPILSSKGDPAHANYMQLTAAYDGILETDAACYVSEKTKRAWAEFKIEMSLVTKVSTTANTSEI